MDKNNISLFACPVCAKQLLIEEKRYLCKAGHCFDIAAGGGVNLLLSGQMNSHKPGDDKDMVRARSAFLGKGYYAPLRAALAELCVRYTHNGAKILDLGCGEGYYTAGISAQVLKAHSSARIAALDISKPAIKLATRSAKSAETAVASVFHLPVASGSVDLAVNCFSPLCIEELSRVLKSGGHFIYVVPGAMHLWGLKSTLYEHPYINEQKETAYPGFKYSEIVRVSEDIQLDNAQDIENLFKMTPYMWKTSVQDTAKLLAKTQLDTKIEFAIHIYEKK